MVDGGWVMDSGLRLFFRKSGLCFRREMCMEVTRRYEERQRDAQRIRMYQIHKPRKAGGRAGDCEVNLNRDRLYMQKQSVLLSFFLKKKHNPINESDNNINLKYRALRIGISLQIHFN